MSKLTQKQNKFVREYLTNGGNATEAYKTAYNTKNQKPETIKNSGYKLLQKGDIKATIDKHNETLADEVLWTRADSVKGLKEIAEDENARANDKTQAIKELNSMHGWKSETVNNTTDMTINGASEEKIQELFDAVKK